LMSVMLRPDCISSLSGDRPSLECVLECVLESDLDCVLEGGITACECKEKCQQPNETTSRGSSPPIALAC
jgi:hypothetical protein